MHNPLSHKTLLPACRAFRGLAAALVAVPVVAACAVPTARTHPAKELYLTFDDGPGGATAGILDVLKANQAQATFFAIGRNLAAHPGLARREIAEGHVLSGHTWSHPDLTRLGPTELAGQLDRSMAAVRDAGSDSTCLRPPYGAVDETVRHALGERGLRSVRWNVDSADWREPSARAIADRLVADAYPGAVVLLHDGGGDRARTVAALRLALPELRAKGYVFRPVPGC
ncbi:polysaccharide deacetylase family protein [Amycolatopsis aidingensis]|uniref:polysaccharide deacetylase family protein n=1 Tax=Amycolatopsis aidingensis TaxID=2842453 RepID=UPI001C0DEB22|nr:polysaccharide deacetylase family protein [Amycolatopsis aidingensis]